MTRNITPAAQPPAEPTLPSGFRGIEPPPATTPTLAASFDIPPGFRGIEPNVSDDHAIDVRVDTDCSDWIIQLTPPNPYAIDQRLLDMKVVYSGWANALKSPTLNSKKTGSVGYSLYIQVHQRVKFGSGTTPGAYEIWYLVGDIGFAPMDWIPVVYGTSTYLVGAPPNEDPCKGIVPNLTNSEYVKFKYDRLKAASYALYHGYYNSINLPGTGRATKRRNPVPITFPFANFTYTPPGTWSANFVSESIWIGGLPMTVGDSDSCTATPANNRPMFGWRYCGVSSQTSPPWDFHEALAEYFTYFQGLSPGVNHPSLVPNTAIYPGDKGYAITFGPTIPMLAGYFDPYMYLSGGYFNNPNGADNLVDYLKPKLGWQLSGGYPPSMEPILRVGDYVWISAYNGATGDYHGLLVIGWADVLTCAEALSRGSNPSTWFTYEHWPVNLYKTYNDAHASSNVTKTSQGTARVVPYVVDYTDPAITQRPMPRPFYCTQYKGDGAGFVDHNWYFFALPNKMHFLRDQVFVNPSWQWSSTSGQ